MTGYEAIEIMTAGGGNFSDKITKAMIRGFSVYPLNEFVVLNTGEIGRVIDINSDNPLRPFVRLIYSVEREELTTPRVIDLARNSQLWRNQQSVPLPAPRALRLRQTNQYGSRLHCRRRDPREGL